MQSFIKLYTDKLVGAISGWDRIRFRGTIRWLATTRGLTSYMSVRNILLKDFGHWAEAITKRVRAACTCQAEKLAIPMMYLKSSLIDKEALARKVADERGVTEGDICMFSVVEPCTAPMIRGNRSTRKLELVMAPRKCVWIYHYWNDPRLGFGHTRLQTWLPLSATICINGRHWLERQLIHNGIGYLKDGNCFRYIEDVGQAQRLLDAQLKTDWPTMLQGLVERNCPILRGVIEEAPFDHYWSADETEWATDLIFSRGEDLDLLYPHLLRHGLVSAQSPAVMRFLGRKSAGGPASKEVISDLRQRYEGIRLKHCVNRNSIKMYNKAGNVLRVETTINNTRDFKVFRHPDDDRSRPASWQRMRKGVSDLHRRAQVSQAANERYLEHLAAAAIDQTLRQVAGDVCRAVVKKRRRYRGLNPLQGEDFKMLQFLARGEFGINGFRNRDLRGWLYPELDGDDPIERKRASGRTTRRIGLLRAHGLIRKVPRTHRYVLTSKGMKITTALLAAANAQTNQLMELAA